MIIDKSQTNDFPQIEPNAFRLYLCLCGWGEESSEADCDRNVMVDQDTGDIMLIPARIDAQQQAELISQIAERHHLSVERVYQALCTLSEASKLEGFYFE